MGKEEYAGWKEVTKHNKGNKSWRCKHCNQVYYGIAPRLRAYLLNIPGKGIACCSADIPDAVIIRCGGDPDAIRERELNLKFVPQ